MIVNENTVQLPLPAADWSAIPITLRITSGSSVIDIDSGHTIAAKPITASYFTIKENGSAPVWNDNNLYHELSITNEVGLTITKVMYGTTELHDYGKGYQVNLTAGDKTASVSVYTQQGGDTPVSLSIFPSGPGAANNSRSIFGFRTKGNTYSATSTSSSTAGEAPKTRSVSLSSWVNDVFNGGSDAAVKTVKDEVKSSAKKASKKSKKAAKSQKVVEKPVVAEHAEVAAEAVSEPSVAPVNEAVETVAATVSAVTEVVEDAATEVDEVSASLEAEAAAPLSAEPEVPDASVESPSASTAAIIMAIAALCAAAAALTIIALKKRAAKK